MVTSVIASKPSSPFSIFVGRRMAGLLILLGVLGSAASDCLALTVVYPQDPDQVYHGYVPTSVRRGEPYFMRYQCREITPQLYQELATFISDKPPEDLLRLYDQGFGLEGDLRSHRQFKRLLNQTLGKSNWKEEEQPTLPLNITLWGRTFGVEELKLWDYDYSQSEFIHFQRTILYFNADQENYDTLINDYAYYLSTESLVYKGPAWPALLIILIPPSLLIFILRKPLLRALRISPPRKVR